ncbi:hypothetical protein PFISCL1PPCAC_7832, partial [Pristionchus fissidentatus]
IIVTEKLPYGTHIDVRSMDTALLEELQATKSSRSDRYKSKLSARKVLDVLEGRGYTVVAMCCTGEGNSGLEQKLVWTLQLKS